MDPHLAGSFPLEDEDLGPHIESREDLQERLSAYATGALAVSGMTIGDKLGLYKGLAAVGPCSSVTLAKHCSLQERWVREWLLQQSAARLVSCDAKAHSFWLTEEQQDVLVNEEGPNASPFFAVGGLTALPYLCAKVDALCDAFRSGMGLRYDQYGPEVARATCRELRVWPRYNLLKGVRSIPDIEAKLQAGCSVADVGCGEAAMLLLLARAYPNSTFAGYDTSSIALSAARKAVADAGLSNVTLYNPSLGEQLPDTPALDVVMTMDALHDMARPDLVMAAVRKALKPDGVWLIGDFACGSPGSNVHDHPAGALLYGYSLHLCMSSALSEEGGLGLGTCGFSQEVAQRLLSDAGFTRFERLEQAPWAEHQLMAFFLARP